MIARMPPGPPLPRLAARALLVGCGAAFVAGPLAAETRSYSYNARGELVASAVSGGPANGVQTSAGYDPAGNRTAYRVVGSAAPLRYAIPIVLPIGGMQVMLIPE